MVVALASLNPSKKKSLEATLKLLKIDYDEIIAIKVDSNVSSKPVGYEIIRGADNRNKASKSFLNKVGLEYDYLCAIEGGCSIDENGIPFIVTYVIIEDRKGKKSTGKSLGLRLRKDMFEYYKNGGSLNKLIEEVNESENNKTKQGITGYLSSEMYERSKVDMEAVVSAFIPFIYKEKRDLLSEKIKEKTKK